MNVLILGDRVNPHAIWWDRGHKITLFMFFENQRIKFNVIFPSLIYRHNHTSHGYV